MDPAKGPMAARTVSMIWHSLNQEFCFCNADKEHPLWCKHSEPDIAHVHSSGSAYKNKSLEMVWGAASESGQDSLDTSCCSDQTVYITCSKQTMLDGRANVLAIMPYTSRCAVDDELSQLESYLIALLDCFFEAPASDRDSQSRAKRKPNSTW